MGRMIAKEVGNYPALFFTPKTKKELWKMNIKYEFLNGEVMEIEVDDALGEIVVEIEKTEYNKNRKETRRHPLLQSAIVGSGNKSYH
jgi:hypothetical protein